LRTNSRREIISGKGGKCRKLVSAGKRPTAAKEGVVEGFQIAEEKKREEEDVK